MFIRLLLIAGISLSTMNVAHAENVLPLKFNPHESESWTQKPHWLYYNNPAVVAHFSINAGVGLFSVADSDRAMKWVSRLTPTEPGRFLVVTYKAQNIAVDHRREYVLYGNCGFDRQNNLLYPEDLVQDGTWQTVVLDLAAEDFECPMEQIAVNLQAAEEGSQPVFLLDFIGYANDIPAGAVVLDR